VVAIAFFRLLHDVSKGEVSTVNDSELNTVFPSLEMILWNVCRIGETSWRSAG
jgi:hypothetical protein